MGTPYLGEVRAFSFNFAPKGWAFCNGQTLPINQNQAIFALLGTTYGGNGTSNFQLPNLQGNTVLHAGNGFVQGQTGGEVNHTLLTTELPAHGHSVLVGGFATARDPKSHTFGTQGLSTSLEDIFSPTANATAAPQLIAAAGGTQPHNNQQPYLVLNFCIALQGIFPSRN